MSRLLLAMAMMLMLQGASSPRAQPSPRRFLGPVATFRIANDGTAASERVISFGQMFLPGSLRPDQAVRVTLNGTVVPAQVDPKALHADGSVRHAVLSVQVPSMTAGAQMAGVVIAAEGNRASGSVRQSVPDVGVALTFASGPQAGHPVRIDLPTLMRAARAGTGQAWLQGPLAVEHRYAAEPIQGIQVVFDVWSPAAGPSRIDVIIHNDSAQYAQIGTRTYDAVITLGSAEVFRAGRVGHYAYATWRHTVWTDGRAPPRMIPDVRLLKAVGAIPQYLPVKPDPATVEALHRLSMAGAQPLGFAAITPYMPTTGGRADIGPLPAWAVFYLLDPSRQNLQTLMSNADAAGSAPWHVRDLRTGGPIDIDRYPKVWLDGRGRAVPGILERKYYTLDTKWQPDDAHQPSLTYLPYLLTGSQYYRDELAMQAGYVLLAIDPQYRDEDAGIVLGSQVRAVAWDLRTLANAAFILPSDDPLQAYFTRKLEANLHEIDRRYISGHELDAAGELRGWLPGPYAVVGGTPPWQDDYLTIVLGWIDSMGYRDARPVLQWMTNFVAGRFTSAGRGYDAIYGTPYYLMVADPHSGSLLKSWSAAFQWTFDPAKPVTTLDSPGSGGGYAALARAALASIVSATGSSQARQAYAFVETHTPRMMENYPREPAFAIGLRPPANQPDTSRTASR